MGKIPLLLITFVVNFKMKIMKKIFLALLLGVFTFSLAAQGIKFEENHDLNAALAKAKAENKLVFIDAFAEWCGPCKVMARDIFPQKEVGDFFNAKFINLKLDMEKGDNVALAKKYEVRAYPTYLFLDAEGNLVHKGLGSMPADQFIEVAKVAADTENNYAALSKKIQNGDRSYNTVKKFVDQNPYDAGNGKLVDEYLQSLSENEIYSEVNWELFNNFVEDMSSPSFQYFLQNKERIAGYIGKSSVDEKISKSMANVYFKDPTKAEYLKTIDSALFAKVKTRVDMYAANGKFRQNKDDKATWDNLIKTAAIYFNESSNPAELNNIAWTVYENYSKFNDKNALKSALTWAKKAHELASDKDHIADTYAHLLYANGKKKEAVEIETKALEMAKKAGNAEAVEGYTKAIESFKKK